MTRAYWPCLLLALAATGCESDASSNDVADASTDLVADATRDDAGTDVFVDVGDVSESDALSEGVTWSTHVAPIMEEHCVTCHRVDGAGPFPLDTFESLETFGSVALDSMEAGRMPPWTADPECRPLEHERLMPDEDIATVRAWIEEGMLPGPAYDSPPFEVTPFEATHTAAIPAAYTPELGAEDDYRCYVLDLEIEEDLYLKASTIAPGNGLVHHVIVYALTDGQIDEARERDAADELTGYTCFGSPVRLQRPASGTGIQAIGETLRALQFPQQLGAWVPGQTPRWFPEDVAMRVERGSLIVMQVHYSAVAGAPEPDSTTEFQAVMTTDEPTWLTRTTPLANRGLAIPAGDPEVVDSMTVTYYGEDDLEIAGMTAHMHLLGTSILTEVVRAGGDAECGLNIPAWDFAWQESYGFEESLIVSNGDSLRLTCTYDNSTANQPIVNGEQQAPRDVEWGDGTLDEMCLTYLQTITPFEPSRGADACSPSCVEDCGTDLQCLAACEGNDVGCFGCVLSETFECGATECAASLLAAQSCLSPCITNSLMLTGGFGSCMESRCGEDYLAAADCLSGVLTRDGCSEARAACGLE